MGAVAAYVRLVLVDAARAFVPGLKSPVVAVVLLGLAYVLTRGLWPDQWIGPSLWEDLQKGAVTLVIFIVLSLVVALLTAPYRLHQEQDRRIGALECARAATPPSVSPLQQTFNFVVTSPEQASTIAQSFTRTQGIVAGATGTSEIGPGSDTTTTTADLDSPELRDDS